jgi:hypothetical protein
MCAPIPMFLKNSQWWIDHLVDILTLIATIVLAFFIHSLDSREREQDAAAQNAATKQLTESQDLGRRQNGAENDLHQAYALLADLQLQRGPGRDAERRAIAEVIEQYAMDGRLYEPASHIFIQLISTECDSVTFEHLRNAIASAANVRRRDAITDEERGADEAIRRQTQEKLASAVRTHNASCNIPQHPEGQTSPGNKQLDVPLGYFDVGCGQPRSEQRSIPLSSIVPAGYKIANKPTADFKDVSNAKQATADAVIQNDQILVTANLVGTDFQSFAFGIKNCPGGGHGTLILHITVEPIAPANGQRAQ